MDPTFGGTGNVAVDFGAPYTVSLATKETLQLDGKVIVVGMASRGTFSNPTGEDFALARFNPDGTRDASFGTLGQTTVDVSALAGFAGWSDEATCVTLLDDGKILVGGFTFSTGNFAVLRFDSDGSIDHSFATNGVAFVDFHRLAFLNSMLVQSDGKILLGGTRFDDMALARLNSDGSLDSSFGVGGTEVLDLGGSEWIRNMALAPDGKFYSVGQATTPQYSNGAFCICRFNRDGELDSTFGDGGRLIDPSPNPAIINGDSYDIAVQHDNKIVAAGNVNGSYGVVRYLPDGELDTDFGQDGVQRFFTSGNRIAVKRVSIAPDGKIIVLGTSVDGYYVARLNPAGRFDSSFGDNGWLIHWAAAAATYSDACGAVFDAHGGIVVMDTEPGSNTSFLTRLDGVSLALLDRDGVLHVNGTSGNDMVRLSMSGSERLRILVNGVKEYVDISLVRQIVIDGGDGDDWISLMHLPIASSVVGGSGNDTIIGGGLNDTVDGGAGDDRIDSGDGDDQLHGSGGSDRLRGGSGDDQFFGDGDNDYLEAGAGNDVLWGGDGDDILVSGRGVDTLSGDAGDDILVATRALDNLTLDSFDTRITSAQARTLILAALLV